MASSEGVQRPRPSLRIKSAAVERRVIDLVETLGEDEDA